MMLETLTDEDATKSHRWFAVYFQASEKKAVVFFLQSNLH